jgi:hypothetical protein
MHYRVWFATLGLALAAAVGARAEITKGVMAVKGAEMT